MFRYLVAVVFAIMAVVTVYRGEFKFPPPVPPITRADFPEGFWPLVAFMVGIAIWLTMHG